LYRYAKNQLKMQRQGSMERMHDDGGGRAPGAGSRERRKSIGGAVQVESSLPVASKRTDGAGIRAPNLLIPAESLASTLAPIK
jgi:hypothetical protein